MRGLHALLVAVLLSAGASGQVIEISGGASTEYGAEGGTLRMHTANAETSIGMGVVDHHFAMGGETVRRIAGGLETVGQQQIAMDLPTDVFQTSHMLFGTGAGVDRGFGESRHLAMFAGVTSEEGGTPLFQTTEVRHVAVFGRWRRRISERCSEMSTGLRATTLVLLESLECVRANGVRVAVTGGVGGGSAYGAASVTVDRRKVNFRASFVRAGSKFERSSGSLAPSPEPVKENVAGTLHATRFLSFSGLRQNYETAACTGGDLCEGLQLTQHSTVNEAGAQYRRRNVGVSLSLLGSSFGQGAAGSGGVSGQNRAMALSSEWRMGAVRWTESLQVSRSAGGVANSALVSGASVQIDPHVRISESVNVSGGQATLAHGGELVTGFSSFRVDYQTVYLPTRPDRPFEQAMIVDAQVRVLRNLSMHAGSSIDATGRTRYTASLGSVLAHNAAGGGAAAIHMSMGLQVITGRVVDESGAGVEGAALMIGAERLYTDSEGMFLFRSKGRRSYALAVLPGEFLADGVFAVTDSPRSVMTAPSGEARCVRIVVARRGAPELRADARPGGEVSR